jgi:5'-nucleotidase/UDP-sugar diphosphatase
MWLAIVALNTALGAVGLAADAARTTVPICTKDVKASETTGGDLVADAILKAGKADVALVNAAQFRTETIAPGKVTAAQISGLLANPDRQWVVSNISGKSLELALERSLSRVPEPSANFLQVGGIRVRFDPKAPAGQRITIQDIKIGGKPAQDGDKYRVAMPEDLAKGGSGYFTVPDFNESTILDEPTTTLAEAVRQFVDQAAELDYSKLDRIVPQKP